MRPPSRPAEKLHAATCAAPRRRALFRLSRAALLGTALVLQSCGGGAVEMNVVVFNYWPRALADVYVNGQHVGAGFGAYGPGGTGGSIWCCYKVKPGPIKVDWTLDGREGDPLTGTTRSATATLKAVNPRADTLGIFLYPNGHLALETGRGIPNDRLP
jgi:hypothetical protein